MSRWIWNIAKAWIDPLTADKVQLLTGNAKIVSEPPYEAMHEFLEPHLAKFIENQRLVSFIDEDTEEENMLVSALYISMHHVQCLYCTIVAKTSTVNTV